MFLMARPRRFERLTFRLGGGCSIQLSYGRMPATALRQHRLLYTLAPETLVFSSKMGFYNKTILVLGQNLYAKAPQ